MKAVLSLIFLAALPAQAQTQAPQAAPQAQDKKADDKGKALHRNPWSVDRVVKSDGYFGSSSTTVTRDVGNGWSLGGKMTTPYEDRVIGGHGAPGLKQYESPSNSTVFGPVLEKQF